MEGYSGWARALDQQVLSRDSRLYNVNNLKLARYKEIFPTPSMRPHACTICPDGQRALG